MTLRSFAAIALLSGAAVTASTSASAQALRQPPRQTLGTNLLAIPFGVFSFDYEHAVGTGGFTVGLGGLHTATGDEDDQITWAQAKLKYYPGETTLKGLAVGITAGALQHRDEYCCDYDPQQQPFTQSAPVKRKGSTATIGVVVDYNWLLGRDRRFLFGIGVGAKRSLKNVDERDQIFLPDGSYRVSGSPLEQVYPDGRFTVGFAF